MASTAAALPHHASSSSFAHHLDASQQQAVRHSPHIPLILDAGPGSGKTHTIVHRLAYLQTPVVDGGGGIPSQRILTLCFSQQAVQNLHHRLRVLHQESSVGPAASSSSTAHYHHRIQVKTLHAFGLACLRRFGVVDTDCEVFSTARQHQLVTSIVERYALHARGHEGVENLLDYIAAVKRRPGGARQQQQQQSLSSSTSSSSPTFALRYSPDQQNAVLFQRYQHELRQEHRAVDFDDLQHAFYELLRPVRQDEAHGGGLTTSPVAATLQRELTHILVDEYQDLNELQFEIIMQLVGERGGGLTAVGDAMQCIYGWRGAVATIFTKTQQRLPAAVMMHLSHNYRSTPELVKLSNSFVKRYHQQAALGAAGGVASPKPAIIRHSTHVHPLLPVQHVIDSLLHLPASAPGAPPPLLHQDIAVLCRTRRTVKAVVKYLRAQQIPAEEVHSLSDHMSAEDVGVRYIHSLLAVLRCSLANPSNADVRVALSVGPLALNSRHQRSLFLQLESTALTAPSSLLVPSSSLSNPDDHQQQQQRLPSFYTLLESLVYHGFDKKVFPKVCVSKPMQKIVRRFTELTTEARRSLYGGLGAGSGGARPEATVKSVLLHIIESSGLDRMTGGSAVVIKNHPSARRARDGGARPGEKRAREGFQRSSLSSSVSIAQRLIAETAREVMGSDGDDEDQKNSSTTVSCVSAPHRTTDSPPAEDEQEEGEYKVVTLVRLLLDCCDRVTGEMILDHQQQKNEEAPGAAAPSSVALTPAFLLRSVLDDYELTILSALQGSSADSEPHQEQLRSVGSVAVATVHQAKGLEWPVVILPGCVEGEFPIRATSAEERRVFYVALTRAKQYLYLITVKSMNGKGASSSSPVLSTPAAVVGGSGSGSTAVNRADKECLPCSGGIVAPISDQICLDDDNHEEEEGGGGGVQPSPFIEELEGHFTTYNWEDMGRVKLTSAASD